MRAIFQRLRSKSSSISEPAYFGGRLYDGGGYTELSSGHLDSVRIPNNYGVFLLERGPFPRNAAMSLWVSNVPRPLMGFPTPLSTATNHHMFHIPGLGFELALGTRIPEHVRKTALTGPGKAIMLSATFEKKLRQGMSSAFGRALSGS